MTKQELTYIQSVIDGIGHMTGLEPKRTKKLDKSTFVVQKTNDFNDGLLGYMDARPWGNYLVFDDYFNTNQLNALSRSTIDHEIAHAVGIGHPYGSGPNPDYTNADTVMSYNRYQYNDGNFMYFGYTPSDQNAISYWWGNTNNAYQPDGIEKEPEANFDGETITIDPHGDHDHKTINSLIGEGPIGSANAGNPEVVPDGLPEVTISQDTFKLTSRNLRVHTEEAKIKGPFIIKLNDDNNILNGKKWDANISDLTDFGRITIKGLAGGDKFQLDGANLNSYGASLSISGGEDRDKISIKEIDGITGSAGLLFGSNTNNPDIPRVIRLTLPDEVTVNTGIEGANLVHTFNPEILVNDDVEIIKIDGKKFKFDDLFDVLSGSEGVLLTDL